jgi:hypothetical protein
MQLIQFRAGASQVDTRVGRVEADGRVLPVRGVRSTHELAWGAIEAARSLATQVDTLGFDAALAEDAAALLAQGRILPPLTHADPAHCLVTGTGLTHLGSATARDRMHQAVKDEAQGGAAVTDSMRMFVMGLEGGKTRADSAGVAPEWFYKGDGGALVAPGAPLPSPDFGLDGGDEAEIVGLYLIGPDARPWRLGFALGNEFSDHVTERQNYLYLAHSKLRPCSVGPELRVGPLPDDVRGTSRIYRDGRVVWEQPFASGEANMCHDIANLEFHHFKYAQFLRPGDVHLHFFGAAVLSFVDGFTSQVGDEFEIQAAGFGLPLRNRLAVLATPFQVHGVTAL